MASSFTLMAFWLKALPTTSTRAAEVTVTAPAPARRKVEARTSRREVEDTSSPGEKVEVGEVEEVKVEEVKVEEREVEEVEVEDTSSPAVGEVMAMPGTTWQG